jgi:hypothetical protein
MLKDFVSNGALLIASFSIMGVMEGKNLLSSCLPQALRMV